jgi:hypothetical protein
MLWRSPQLAASFNTHLAGLVSPLRSTPFPSWFLRLCKETAPATGEAGAVVQCAGREEEEADTRLILVVGRQFPIYYGLGTSICGAFSCI